MEFKKHENLTSDKSINPTSLELFAELEKCIKHIENGGQIKVPSLFVGDITANTTNNGKE